MATLQLEDLLRDELAGNGRGFAWECALQTLFLRSDPSALARIKSQSIKAEVPLAIQNLGSWIAQAGQAGALGRIDPTSELPRLAQGLSTIEQAMAAGHSPDGGLIRQSVQELLDEEVFQFLGHQDRFYRQLAFQMELLDSELRQKFKTALGELEAGLGDVGIARSDALRVSRIESQFVADSNKGDFCTAAALVAAVASWKLTRSVEETKRLLRRAWGRAQREADSVSWPIARFLGHLEWMDDDPDLAWSALFFAADQSGDGETIMEAARLAIQLRKWDQARSLVLRGSSGSGLFLIRVLACDEFVEIAGDVLEALVQKQREMRQEVGLELAAWNTDTHRIKQAGKKAGSTLAFLDDFDESRKSVAAKIAGADLFGSISLCHHARAQRHEAVRLAAQQLGAEYSEAVKLLEMSQVGISHAWVEREAIIEAAVARQTAEVQVAREALHASLKEADKTQSGCMVAMGSGCGAFVLYLFIAGFLTAQGISAGFGTIFGWFGLAASGLPIFLAVMAQIAYGAQRAALDKALHDKMRIAQAAYEIAAKQADRHYREEVLKFKEGLGDIEARAKRLEEGLQTLNG